jgi:CRP-like cAMP-binding protein
MALKDDIALFSRVPVFSGMNEEQLRLLAFGAEKRRLSPRETLFSAGTPAEGAYIVSQGRLALTTSDKGKIRRMEDAGPATLLCELALISSLECPFTAAALEECEVIQISRSLFYRLLEEFPEVADALEKRIVANLESMVLEISRLSPRFS